MKEEWFKHPTNIVDLFEDTVKKFGERNFLGTKNSSGETGWTTFERVAKRVDDLRGELARTNTLY